MQIMFEKKGKKICAPIIKLDKVFEKKKQQQQHSNFMYFKQTMTTKVK